MPKKGYLWHTAHGTRHTAHGTRVILNTFFKKYRQAPVEGACRYFCIPLLYPLYFFTYFKNLNLWH
ncbi:MAG: hypothetical protein CSB06_02185 [Bacteroidia bacterium]|nr:MAG: hypothetical protein CSB06_02185 [Bacteroidia bacterium]